jgi:hypothetical protein
MTPKRKIQVVIEKSVRGFSAFTEAYPIFTTGTTMNELIDNTIEACSLYFENERFDPTQVSFEIDFKQFF